MTAIVVNDADETILKALKVTLQEATVDGDNIFDVVSVYGSRDEARGRAFTTSPIASLLYLETETFEIPDLTVGCVLRLEIMVAAKGDSPVAKRRALTKAINQVRNALHTSIPSTANGFPEPEGDYHPRMFVGTLERDDEPKDPWVVAWLPVEVAYRTTARTTH